MKSKQWSVTLLACAVMPLASAQAAEPFNHPFDIGVEFGQAEQAYSHSGEDNQIDEHDTGMRVFGSYYFTPSVAVRVGYADLGDVTLYNKQYHDAFLDLQFDELSATSSPTAITLGGIFSLPINQSPFVFGVEFGVAQWDVDVATIDARTDGNGGTTRTNETYSSSGVGFYGGGELSYQFTQQFTVGVSARWYNMEPEINNDADFEMVVQTLNLTSVIRF